MEIKRRLFLKLVGFSGIALLTPGLAISDILQKTGEKNAEQNFECKEFGEFLISVVDKDGVIVKMPKKFVEIISRTAKNAGILGNLKKDSFILYSWTSDELLEDKPALGYSTWEQLNDGILRQPCDGCNDADTLSIAVGFNRDESVFRFFVRAT